MYYVLEYEVPTDEEGNGFDLQDGLEFAGIDSWALGRPFKKPPPNPIRVDIEPIEGFKGEPAEMYDGNMCFFSNKMAEVLTKAGVNNIDLYPAVLRNTETGKEYQYKAANILSLIAAANEAASEFTSFDQDNFLDTDFSRVVIDPKKAKGQLMFRLAESTGTIIVHEKVKKALEGASLYGLRFIPATE